MTLNGAFIGNDVKPKKQGWLGMRFAKNNVMVFVLAAVFFSFFAGPASAKLYKWVDKNGVTHYSQTPPPQSENVKVKTLGEIADQESFNAPVLYRQGVSKLFDKQFQRLMQVTRSKAPSGLNFWFYIVERNNSTENAWDLTVKAYFEPNQTGERIRKGKYLRMITQECDCGETDKPEEWPTATFTSKYCQVARPGKPFDDVSLVPSLYNRPFSFYSRPPLSDDVIVMAVDNTRQKMEPRDGRIRQFGVAGVRTVNSVEIPSHILIQTDRKTYNLYFQDGKWSEKYIYKKAGKKRKKE